jgi:transposase
VAARTGPNPTDRAKRGSKRHLVCDAQGVPLAIRLTGVNRNDSQEALALVDAIAPLQGERGRPRCRPVCVVGDRGYDAAAIRQGLRTRHIVALLARRRTSHGSGLGRWRWVIERTFAWLNQFRRLRVRYDKRADIHEAFRSLACVWICWQSLRATVRPRYGGAVREKKMSKESRGAMLRFRSSGGFLFPPSQLRR